MLWMMDWMTERMGAFATRRCWSSARGTLGKPTGSRTTRRKASGLRTDDGIVVEGQANTTTTTTGAGLADDLTDIRTAMAMTAPASLVATTRTTPTTRRAVERTDAQEGMQQGPLVNMPTGIHPDGRAERLTMIVIGTTAKADDARVQKRRCADHRPRA